MFNYDWALLLAAFFFITVIMIAKPEQVVQLVREFLKVIRELLGCSRK